MDNILSGVAGLTSVLATGAVLYRCLRPRFPVKVNCHFCNTDTHVPYGNQNCWDCPSCDQYNGFSLDGDYNKPIPAQFSEDLNHPISAEQRPPSNFSTTSVLCDQCSANQLLKVKQLANFVPYEEANYDAEVDAYRNHLEHVYHLCRQCERKVDRSLQRQNNFLHEKLCESGSPARSEASQHDTSFTDGMVGYIALPIPWYVRLLRAIVFCCACLILLGNTCTIAQKLQLVPWPLDYVIIHVTQTLHNMWSRSLVFIALFLNIGAIVISGKESLTGVDALSCIFWLTLVTLQSPSLGHWLPLRSVHNITPLLSLVTTVTGLWCVLCPRYRRAASPMRVRTRRLRPDSPRSHASSHSLDVASQSGFSDSLGQRPPSQASQAETELDNGLEAPLDDLETLSIGEPMHLNDRGLFSSPAQPMSTFTSNSSGQNHIRQRPLLSPARLSGASLKQTGRAPTGLGGKQYNRQHSFGLPKVRNGPNQRERWAEPQQSLFQPLSTTSQVRSGLSHNSGLFSNNAASQRTSGLSGSGGLFSSMAFDDRVSLFSQPRQNRDGGSSHNSSSSSEDSFVSQSRASTTCPVDSTFAETEDPTPVREEPPVKKSVFNSLVLGFSIGLNLCLILYFLVDHSMWLYIATKLSHIHQQIYQLSSFLPGIYDSGSSRTISELK